MMEINVGGQTFCTKKETLAKCAYFQCLFEQPDSSTEEKIFIDRDDKAFRHILRYLRDDTYHFPKKYRLELDFYGVNYPKYSQMRKNDLVDIYVSGVKFTLKASFLMEGSTYFEKELSQLYVGSDLHLNRSVKGFTHLLARIRDKKHYIPVEYINDLKFYEGPSIKWTDETQVKYRVSEVKFCTSYEVLVKIPTFKTKLEKGYSPNWTASVKGWTNLLEYVQGYGPALFKYKNLYNCVKVVPTEWYRAEYRQCGAGSCRTVVKVFVNKEYIYSESGARYCADHVCKQCNQQSTTKDGFCKEHTQQ